MNAPIRRVAVVLALMFCALLVSTSYTMTLRAPEIRANKYNKRTLLENYGRERGEIIVAGKPVATSVPVDDDLKYLRTYPDKDLYAHVTGYYSYTYGAGGGIELTDDSLLAGTSDKLFIHRAANLLSGDANHGASVETTINPKVQKAAYDALAGRRGAVVALDPKTGAILAMVSLPSYDPGRLSAHDQDDVAAYWKILNSDTGKPLINKAMRGDGYPPGSTFKLVTAAAAISSGEYKPETQLPAPRTFRLPGTTVDLPNFAGEECNPGSTRATLEQSLEVSCNTSFAWLGIQLGDDKLREQARKFGWDADLETPIIPAKGVFPDGLDKAQTAKSAIGQQDVRATPLRIAMVSAGIANKGSVMRPYLVQSVRGSNLGLVEQAKPSELSRALDEQQAGLMKDMMVKVVQAGTGKSAAIPGVTVAGKTGTAEFGTQGKAHAWFTGFAPADDPKIAVAVIIEGAQKGSERTTGGALAAPVAEKVMEAMVNQ